MAEIGEISGETIKSAMSLAIKNAFAITSGTPAVTTYPKIYKEKIVQNFKTPCFFVWLVDVSLDKQFGNNYDITYQTNIRFHDVEDNATSYEKLNAIGIKLLEVFKELYLPINVNGASVNKKIYSNLASYNIAEDVLQFYVTFVVKAYIPQTEIEQMKELLINQS